jgi:copper chaperone CopZ
MKQLILCLSLFLTIQSIDAQVKPKPVKADIKTPTATCDACKSKIEPYVIKSIDGLLKITVQISRGITQVQYYPDRTNIEEIKTAISNAGCDADDIGANPDIYMKLPDCCKKIEDRKQPPPPKKH